MGRKFKRRNMTRRGVLEKEEVRGEEND